MRGGRYRRGLGGPFGQPGPVAPWPGAVVVCIAGGPSLTREQCARAERSGARLLGINDAYRIARLDALYACDFAWWEAHGGVPAFQGLKFSQDARACERWPEIRRVPLTGHDGFEVERWGVRGGGNGGYQAVNLAWWLGARRVILLGYDMKAGPQGRHWFGNHPGSLNKASRYELWVEAFRAAAPAMAAAGLEVLNATPGSALDCFPRVGLDDALEDQDDRPARQGHGLGRQDPGVGRA